jgi:hypothetical protein
MINCSTIVALRRPPFPHFCHNRRPIHEAGRQDHEDARFLALTRRNLRAATRCRTSPAREVSVLADRKGEYIFNHTALVFGFQVPISMRINSVRDHSSRLATFNTHWADDIASKSRCRVPKADYPPFDMFSGQGLSCYCIMVYSDSIHALRLSVLHGTLGPDHPVAQSLSEGRAPNR